MHSKIRGIVFCLLSFVLSFVLLLLSISVMLEATILNPSYILDNMNTTNYFTDKKDEITRELVDLGYASGLEESFFGNVVETIQRITLKAIITAARQKSARLPFVSVLIQSLTAT